MQLNGSGPTAGPAPAIHAIIPAGGAGTRLWPLSRRHRPKFLLDLTGAGHSLLEDTVERLAPLAATTTVVTGVAHIAAVADQLPSIPRENLLAEPSPRDSMAAIGLAAAVIAHRHGLDAVVGSFAADHTVADRAAFADAVRQAAMLAEQGWVVTIGIEATGPSTAFGYIHTGDPTDVPGAPDGRQVLGFTEKPDADTAAAYLAAVWDAPEREEVLAERWPDLEKIAIDHAIAEPVAAAGGVATVPVSMGWNDVGGFDALTELVAPRDQGPAAGACVLDGVDGSAAEAPGVEVQAIGSDGALIASTSTRTVVLLGVPGAVVVDTPDALLVTTPERAQDVKGVVDALRAAGRQDLL